MNPAERRLVALAEKGATEKFRAHLAALSRPLDDSVLFDALRRALVWNQPEKVRLLLEAGANPLRTNEQGDQVLMHAAMSGSGSLVSLMLSLGCDVNHRNVHHWTAIHTAADAGNIEGLRILLHAGGDPDCRDARNVSPLMAALVARREECALELIRRGADVRAAQSPQRVTPLMVAAGNGAAEVLGVLLKKGADPESVDFQGCTALMHAARSGNAEVVRLLLEAGADRDAMDGRGRTALLWASSLRPEIFTLLLRGPRVSPGLAREALQKASSEGNIPVMRALLGQAAGIQSSREGGESALARAALHPAPEALELLLGHPQCAINYRHGSLLETALMTAARSGAADKVRLLLRHGADPAIMDGRGRTAVNHAAVGGDTEILDLLRRAGAQLEHADFMGRTPLHDAIHDTGSPVVSRFRTQTVRWLLQHGLDPDRADNAGMTPLMYAALEACADSVSLLLAAGAHVDRRDELGRSVLMHALYHGTEYGWNERYARPRLEGEDRAVPVIRRLLAAGADPEGEKALACARHWRWPGTVGLLRDAAGQGRSPQPPLPFGTGEDV